MAESLRPLTARSRASPWGSLVALTFAALFAVVGLTTLNRAIVPSHLGVFIEPPPWLFGAVLLATAVFLTLVGIFELASYIKPSIEVVVDHDGVSAYGLLGRRRLAWSEIEEVTVRQGIVSIAGRAKGQRVRRTLNIAAARLDVPASEFMRRLRLGRPDLDMPWDWSLEGPDGH